MLTAALSQAVKWRLLATSPATGVKPPRPARVEMQTLTAQEMRQLLQACEQTPLFAPVLLWLTTGLRRGELLGLMWRDLDRASGRLSVVRSLEETKQGVLLKTPKTARSTRVLAVPQIALDVLHRHELAQKEHRLASGPAYRDHGLIFPDRLGHPQRPRNVTKAFAALAARVGLGFHPRPTPHAHYRVAPGRRPSQGRLGARRARLDRLYAPALRACPPGHAAGRGGSEPEACRSARQQVTGSQPVRCQFGANHRLFRRRTSTQPLDSITLDGWPSGLRHRS